MCASLLCSTFADVPSASIFPVADMGLQLTFDLDPATRSSVQRGEQCFPFFPNTQFQGECAFVFYATSSSLSVLSIRVLSSLTTTISVFRLWHIQEGLC